MDHHQMTISLSRSPASWIQALQEVDFFYASLDIDSIEVFQPPPAGEAEAVEAVEAVGPLKTGAPQTPVGFAPPKLGMAWKGRSQKRRPTIDEFDGRLSHWKQVITW